LGIQIIAPHCLCPMHSSIDYVFPLECTFYGVVDISVPATGTCHFGDDTLVRGSGTWHNSSTSTVEALQDPDTLNGPQVSRSLIYSFNSVVDSFLWRSIVSNANVDINRSSITGSYVIAPGLIEDTCISCDAGLPLRTYGTGGWYNLIHGESIYIKNCNFYSTIPDTSNFWSVGCRSDQAQRFAGDIQIVNCRRSLVWYQVLDIQVKNAYTNLELLTCGNFTFINDEVYDNALRIITNMGGNNLIINNCTWHERAADSNYYDHWIDFRASPTTGGYDLSGEFIDPTNPKLNITLYDNNRFYCYGWKEEYEPDEGSLLFGDTGVPVGELAYTLADSISTDEFQEALVARYTGQDSLKLFKPDLSGAPNGAEELYLEASSIPAEPCYLAP